MTEGYSHRKMQQRLLKQHRNVEASFDSL